MLLTTERSSPSLRDLPPVADHRRLHLVIGGHVDHGKSTIIGRLLAATGSLPLGKLEAVRANCERNSKPFEYAFLLDALKDEQSQGITIDAARVFFRTASRPYILIDAPGHIEFLRNLITGAARAEAALLVIDAREGVRENSRRHGTMMSLLGIRQLVVLVNKMDLVGYDGEAFARIEDEYRAFLAKIGVEPLGFIPVSGREGDNIARPSAAMPWYDGPTVLETLDRFRSEVADADKPFRMPVQDVYKFTAGGDDRRIVAGTVETGRIAVGDEVVFLPSGKRSRVATVEGFNVEPRREARAGEVAGFTLEEQIYVARGEVATVAGQPAPRVATRLKASLFWLGRKPLETGREVVLKLGTARVPARIEAIHRVLDASTLATDERRDRVERHEVAECTLRTVRPIAFDLAAELAGTGRFVIVDDYEIRGGGIVREALEGGGEGQAAWGRGQIDEARRVERNGHTAGLVLVTHGAEAARALEAALFDGGAQTAYLEAAAGRVADAVPVLLDAGLIAVVDASAFAASEIAFVRDTAGHELTVVSGPAGDVGVPEPAAVRAVLQEKGILRS
ncbi:MAG: adenylyl-sulfate kinase [Planctomycetia bacterium]|nr:adenylyl-sulfate kinase [Planctomycetia bacterium]